MDTVLGQLPRQLAGIALTQKSNDAGMCLTCPALRGPRPRGPLTPQSSQACGWMPRRRLSLTLGPSPWLTFHSSTLVSLPQDMMAATMSLDLLNMRPVQHYLLILKPTEESADMLLSIRGVASQIGSKTMS